jgi:hypothetical protein
MGFKPFFYIFEDDSAFRLVEHFVIQPVVNLAGLILGAGYVIKHPGTGGVNKDVIGSLDDNKWQRSLACLCCDSLVPT